MARSSGATISGRINGPVTTTFFNGAPKPGDGHGVGRSRAGAVGAAGDGVGLEQHETAAGQRRSHGGGNAGVAPHREDGAHTLAAEEAHGAPRRRDQAGAHGDVAGVRDGTPDAAHRERDQAVAGAGDRIGLEAVTTEEDDVARGNAVVAKGAGDDEGGDDVAGGPTGPDGEPAFGGHRERVEERDAERVEERDAGRREPSSRADERVAPRPVEAPALPTDTKRPTPASDAASCDKPKLTKGRGMPVTGRRPVAVPMLMSATR